MINLFRYQYIFFAIIIALILTSWGLYDSNDITLNIEKKDQLTNLSTPSNIPESSVKKIPSTRQNLARVSLDEAFQRIPLCHDSCPV